MIGLLKLSSNVLASANNIFRRDSARDHGAGYHTPRQTSDHTSSCDVTGLFAWAGSEITAYNKSMSVYMDTDSAHLDLSLVTAKALAPVDDVVIT